MDIGKSLAGVGVAAVMGLGLTGIFAPQVFSQAKQDLEGCDNISLKQITDSEIIFDANLCRRDTHNNIVVDAGNLRVSKEMAGKEVIENVIGRENAQIVQRILSDIDTLNDRFPSSKYNFVKDMKCEKNIDVKGVDMQTAFTHVNVETRKPYIQPMGMESGCLIKQYAIFALGDIDKNTMPATGTDIFGGLEEIEADFGSETAEQIKDLYFAAKAIETVKVSPQYLQPQSF